MTKRVNVLVFPCGAENASEIHQALRYSIHVELHGASSVEDHGRFRFERYAGGLPNINEPGFDAAFASVISSRGIDMVFATHDTVLEHLAAKAAQLGFYLVNGDLHAVSVARRKSLTYQLFADCAWAPEVFPSAAEVTDWPIVVKPDRGQGGQGVQVASDAADVARIDVADPILVEHLPGPELTVDCFSDRHRKLVWVGPRTRERVRAGIAMRSQLLPLTPEISDIADTINRRLTLRGPWFFQVKRDRNGRWKLLEICCRVGGTMVAQRAWGINLPLMAVQDYLGRDLTAMPNRQVGVVERSICTKASLDHDYDTVYMDLDDTLIVDGHVNPVAIAFLYQSRGDSKRVILLTRHAAHVEATLRGAKIAPDLFDEIIHIGPQDAKVDHVRERSIFIDNHFPERAAVALARGIPVLDVDALEFFLR